MQSDVQHEITPAWTVWLWPLVITLGWGLPFVWWRRKTTTYRVYDDRVTRTRGWLGTTTEEYQLSSVKSIRTKQSASDKLLSVGTVTLDTGVDELTLRGVPNYGKVASTIRESIS